MDFSTIFGAKPQTKKVRFYYAYELIVAGLQHYCGDNAEWLPEYNKIVDWLKDNHGKGLFVLGDAGRGKSLICRDIIPKIINSKGEHDKCGVTTAYRLAALGDVPFHRGYLVIDDIGVETDHSDFGMKRNIVRELIDEAEINKNCLILTSNLTLEDLSNKYGERSIDRLKSICTFITTTGDSLRGKKKVNGIPKRFRAYGIDFKTQDEALAFQKEQDLYYGGLNNGGYNLNIDDKEEYFEHQPLKLYNGCLYALCKYDWSKFGQK